MTFAHEVYEEGQHRRTRSATHTKTMAPNRISTRPQMRSGNQSRPKNNR